MRRGPAFSLCAYPRVILQASAEDVASIDLLLAESEKVRGSAVRQMHDLIEEYEEQDKQIDREVGRARSLSPTARR